MLRTCIPSGQAHRPSPLWRTVVVGGGVILWVDLAVNQDIKSRVTYSVVTKRLHDDVVREFIHRELDRIGLAHSTFTTGATELIIRSADGVL
ncbi:MAG: hypothetical protein ACK6DC_18545, partial [Planctomycetota bacterium]